MSIANHPVAHTQGARLSAYLTNLTNEGLIHFEGPETVTFLQGQVSCDVRNVSLSNALTGAYCTPKGRVIADFLLGQVGTNHWLMRLRSDIAEHTANVLSKYIVFSKSELDSQRTDWITMGCWGAEAATTLKEHFGDIPNELHASIATNGALIIQRDNNAQRFELWLEREHCCAQIDALSANCLHGSLERWTGMDIESGLTRVSAATTETMTPQALNYDLTGQVDFRKGCYTGQEVVARLHYKGESKRRTFAARLNKEDSSKVGTDIVTLDGSTVGTVLDQGLDEDQCTVILFELAIKAREQTLQLGNAENAQPITLLSLPYPYPSKSE
ncbi:MAG: hypothetical protein ABJD70_07840 [Halioglobus sp.]